MLESSTIRHVALIDDVSIGFHRGMQVLTGETGAGKSIVVDSVNLILGGRADREMIRSGSDKASVEAVFSVKGNPDVFRFLENEGIDFDGETVTVYREITTSGRNICRICGVLIPVMRLKDLAALLMDLHGQSEHQFLADPNRHLAFLDQSGDQGHRNLLHQIREEYEQFIGNHRAYAKLVRQNENRETRMRSLEHDLDELKKANIKAGEEASLTERRKQLEKAEKEAEMIRSVNEMLTGGDSINALTGIKQAADRLKHLTAISESYREISDRCETLYYEAEDLAYQISLKAKSSEYESGSLEKTDERLDLIHRLERKYGAAADQLPALLKEMEEEYRNLSSLEKEVERMAAEHKRLLSAYRKTARELTESRRRIAAGFENRMMTELNDLGMGNTRFEVAFKENETGRPLMPTENGDDRIEFMISPNPGEPLKPLAKIASGGELSRIMLAFKTLETSRTGVDAMVFDEIDTGISGRMAQVVAEKMITISRMRQVICVTHLPQIAAAADYQFLVRKTVSDGRTSTSVEELDRTGRTHEVSRMISGADGITAQSDAYASSLLRAADESKHRSE